MKHFEYVPEMVCPQNISFDIENGKLYNLSFLGGCNGNLKALSKLLEGMNIAEIIEKLQGNTCGRRPTSCADQLTKALKIALEK